MVRLGGAASRGRKGRFRIVVHSQPATPPINKR
jgi:hypothetical protein